MIPKEHPEAIWPGEQALLPVEEPPSRRAWSRLFRVLGMVVPLVTSFACAFIDLSLLTMTIPFLLGLVSAGLLRSWWSIFIVPIAFSMGLVLSSIFLGSGVFLSSMANPVFAGPPAFAFLAVFGIVPLVIGAAIGTPIGMMIGRLLRKRATIFQAPNPEHGA